MSLPRIYNCLIVDDEPPAREVLRRYIGQLPMLSLAGECSNALQALVVLNQQPIDVLFLDIQMPQISGMDLIRTLKHAPRIVLTTAFEQYAVQAFELDVTDYLVKPIRFERFLKAVIKALPGNELSDNNEVVSSAAEPNANFLYFRADRKMVKVLLNDILYIESLKDYVSIFTVKGTVITKHSMAALEAMLPTAAFMRIHRSFIIALDKVEAFTPEEIGLHGKSLPIGKLYRQMVLKSLNNGIS